MKVIYSIINLKTGKQYIGSTNNLYKRKSKHFSLLKKNKHHSKSLQCSWNKNSEEDYKFIILENVKEGVNIYDREQYYLDKYKTYDKKYGYNMTKYAVAPYYTNSIKKVFQFSLQGKLINSFNNCVEASEAVTCDSSGINKCCKGLYRFYKNFIWSFSPILEIDRIIKANNPSKRSEESKLKMSISAFKRVDNLKPVLQFDLNNVFIKEWNSISEIVKTFGYSNGYLSDCLNKKHKKAYGFIWKFKKENNEE